MGKVAIKGYDWYLLGITIAVQLNKSNWKTRLCIQDTIVVNHDLVIRAVHNVDLEELRLLLLSVFHKGHISF